MEYCTEYIELEYDYDKGRDGWSRNNAWEKNSKLSCFIFLDNSILQLYPFHLHSYRHRPRPRCCCRHHHRTHTRSPLAVTRTTRHNVCRSTSLIHEEDSSKDKIPKGKYDKIVWVSQDYLIMSKCLLLFLKLRVVVKDEWVEFPLQTCHWCMAAILELDS